MSVRVLLIEDNEQNRYLSGYLLRARGCEVFEAESGSVGVELAGACAPDLVLLDIQLPELDGYQVRGVLLSIDALRGLPVVAVTSFAMAGDRERALSEGFDGYLEKPIDPASFVDEVLAVLQRRREGGNE